MIISNPGVLGVCSWSLRPQGPADLARQVQAVGLAHLQLALGPLDEGRWNVRETVGRLQEARIAIRSGMMEMKGEDYSTLESIRQTGGLRPPERWPGNLETARRLAPLARRLGIGLVTFHAGFLPHSRSDPEHGIMIERLRQVADVFLAEGVSLGLETGQERADTLLQLLEDLKHPGVGVNFDPANMILYGQGDPVEALHLLHPHVLQIHLKDAVGPAVAGTWGSEVPVGTGAVDWPAFMALVQQHLPGADLMIEREAGDDRVADMLAARRVIEELRA